MAAELTNFSVDEMLLDSNFSLCFKLQCFFYNNEAKEENIRLQRV